MQESMPTGAMEAPPPSASATVASAGATHLADPRALQILATEHWSLLASRSLSYNETFARAGMILTFLGASLVALGLVAGATGFTPQLALVAAVVLATDLFIGLATLGRILDASSEEMACIAGMNRIRHAYREMVPGIEPYFSTPFHDDGESILLAYGSDQPGALAGLLHGLTTAPAMIAVVDCVVAGALVATVVLGLGAGSDVAFVSGVIAFFVVFGLATWYLWSTAVKWTVGREARFPAPRDMADRAS
jgi:hypothetical protein